MNYAQWDGEKGVGRQDGSKGWLRAPSDGHRITLDQADSYGLWPVIVNEPTVLEGQIKDQPVWAFTGTQITLTWSVRDKTQDELDEDTASGVLDRQLYYVLKWLFDEGVITQTNVDNAPQALRDAWAARQRLEA